MPSSVVLVVGGFFLIVSVAYELFFGFVTFCSVAAYPGGKRIDAYLLSSGFSKPEGVDFFR